MIRSLSSKSLLFGVVLTLVLLVAAFLLPPFVTSGVKNSIVIVLGLLLLVILAPATKSRLAGGLYLFIFLFVVGQRTLHLGPYIRLVPSEILVWILCLLVLLYHAFVKGRVSMPLPWHALILLLLTTGGIVSGYLDGRDPTLGISYAKSFLLLVPVFYVVYALVERWEQVRTSVGIVSAILVLLSALGLAEYFDLGFVRLFPDFFVDPGPILAGAEGFQRANASFWGGPMLSAFLMLLFPLTLAQLKSTRSVFLKGLYLVGLIGAAFFIYFAGHRGIWFAFLVMALVYAYFKGATRLARLLLLALLVSQFVPDEMVNRVEGIYSQHQDSSTLKRTNRALSAIDIAIRYPLGAGWGASGLVHSDFLQVAADCGVAAMVSWLLFYWWVLAKLKKSIRKATNRQTREYLIACMAALSGFFIALWTQSYLNLPEYWAPFWFVFALGSRLADMTLESLVQTPQPKAVHLLEIRGKKTVPTAI